MPGTSTSAWGAIYRDTLDRIVGDVDSSPAGITPTYDAPVRWRYLGKARAEGEPGRDRLIMRTQWSPRDGVEVYGGGEDQLGRVLELEVSYLASEDFEDRRHNDERDLVAALEPRGSYPSNSTWALRVRRVMRDDVSMTTDEDGAITVVFPVLHIWREETVHIS